MCVSSNNQGGKTRRVLNLCKASANTNELENSSLPVLKKRAVRPAFKLPDLIRSKPVQSQPSKWSTTHLILILLFILFSTGGMGGMCGGTGGGLGGGGSFDGGEGGESGGDGGGDGEAIGDPIMTGAPSFSNMLVAAADENGNVPGIGFPGAVGSDYTDGTIIMTEETITTSILQKKKQQWLAQQETIINPKPDKRTKNKTLTAKVLDKVFSLFPSSIVSLPSSLVKDTHALSISSVAYAESVLCDEDGYACCPIESDGSFVCYADGTNASVFNFYVTHDDIIEPGTSKNVNINVMWLIKTPKDLQYSGPNAGGTGNVSLALTEDMLVKVTETDGVFTVNNSYLNGYLAEPAVNAQQMAQKESGGYLSLREPLTGISLFFNQPSMAFAGWQLGDSGNVTTTPDTKEYTVLKKSTGDDFVRYGREPISVEIEHKIYEATGDSAYDIKFLDSNLHGLSHQKTLAFDVNAYGMAMVLFEDDDGKLWIVMGDGSAYTIPTSEITGNITYNNESFGELIIYNTALDAVELTYKGNALLVDHDGDKIWFITFFITPVPSNNYISYDFTDNSNSVAVGDNPQGIAITADGSKAYVVNQDDGTLSILTLKDTDGNPLVVPSITTSTVNIADNYLNGISTPVQPYAITLYGDHLLIGAKGLKSMLNIPLSSL